MTTDNDPIEVLTPIAASTLFGKSTEAVRRASREGRVRTRFELNFNGRDNIRCMDLESALHYWAEDPWPAYRGTLAQNLKDLRDFGMLIEVSGDVYRVLHPWPLVHRLPGDHWEST